MKIGAFTDPHYCDNDMVSGTRHHRLSFEKIKEAMDFFKEMKVEMVICLGDLVDDCKTKEKNIHSIKKIATLINSYEIPFYCVMGNHDYDNFTREEFNQLTKGAYPPFSIELDNSVLVFLDCCYEDSGEIYQQGKVRWDNSFLPNYQFEKLVALLNSTSKEVYIFMHQNLDNEVDSKHIVRNAEEIRTVIDKARNVRMVIQGHYHCGHENVINYIKYHTLPAMCEGNENYFEILDI